MKQRKVLICSAIFVGIGFLAIVIWFFVHIETTFAPVEEVAFGRYGRAFWDYEPALQRRSVVPDSEFYVIVYTFKRDDEVIHWLRTDKVKLKPEITYEEISVLGGDSPNSIQPGSELAAQMNARMITLDEQSRSFSIFDRVPYSKQD